MKSRIIVCGLNRTGYKIFCLLRQQGADVVGVHDKPIAGEETRITIGDLQAASTLVAAGIQEAKTLVLASADETVNLAILMQARVLNPLAAPVSAFAVLGTQAIGQLRLFDRTRSIHAEQIDQTASKCLQF